LPAKTLTAMQRAARKHRIVVAARLHREALARLDALFELEHCASPDAAQSIPHAAGLMLSQEDELPPAFLDKASRLQAVGLTGQGAGRMNLAAMTNAGIRVTHAPLEGNALIAQALWRSLERALNARALEQAESAVPMRALRRSSPAGHPKRLSIRFAGDGPVTLELAALAREAGFHCASTRLEQDEAAACEASAHVLVLVEESVAPAAASIGVTSMGDSSPSHPDVIDLRTERQRHAMPDALCALRDQLAVDGLIAAIGMGRDSFHPRFLLNPEVCSLSCC